ncbi:hypothetical protein AVEN_225946-1 [Araneus ventricosus]|uniref:Uncharacterized protein n=1 Tax=Araneus ventricosus TaxID=182803 RepID=A0A4Y2GNB0_ARAVE|nr:hypothetical protein AVEN_225946-1 [Araneus ventricosus]
MCNGAYPSHSGPPGIIILLPTNLSISLTQEEGSWLSSDEEPLKNTPYSLLKNKWPQFAVSKNNIVVPTKKSSPIRSRRLTHAIYYPQSIKNLLCLLPVYNVLRNSYSKRSRKF